MYQKIHSIKEQETVKKNSQKKTVLILGSTGSVGSKAVEIFIKNKDLFDVKAIVAGKNAKKIAKQAIGLEVENIALFDSQAAFDLQNILSEHNQNINSIQVSSGHDAIVNLSSQHYDIVISAITGIAGLIPTIQAAKTGCLLAIANKESIVCGGHILMALAFNHGTKIIPLDSEHHAIERILGNGTLCNSDLHSIILTASGGPFWFKSDEEMAEAEISDVLRHPTWKMGQKITTDCATMMNKGFELIEASYLFDISMSKIDVLIHPESHVHGIVHLNDGSSLTYLSNSDMAIPICHALSIASDRFKARHNNNPKQHYDSSLQQRHLSLDKIGNLRFFAPNYQKFPLLKVAKEAFEDSVQATILLNAINEVAVDDFLKGRIKFKEIPYIVMNTMNTVHLYKTYNIANLEEVIAIHDEICIRYYNNSRAY